ncbi:hypothetical protein Q4555_00185 [Octadecabacter sp. 1_MG-2023]|nr:hypothetical protein [Octadecabacter sp. 1_MG-2023]MDO6733065.1 hypothetical protein [Octadecabacter sp. 1_MG-2023]
MPIDYQFLSNPSLAFIYYQGHITADDLICAATRFAKEPTLEPGLPHFFDFSRVASYDIDYPKYFAFMAQLADIYPQEDGEQLFVFYAPEGPPAEMAEMARKPWEGSKTAIIRAAFTLNEALDILGGPRADLVSLIDRLAEDAPA